MYIPQNKIVFNTINLISQFSFIELIVILISLSVSVFIKKLIMSKMKKKINTINSYQPATQSQIDKTNQKKLKTIIYFQDILELSLTAFILMLILIFAQITDILASENLINDITNFLIWWILFQTLNYIGGKKKLSKQVNIVFFIIILLNSIGFFAVIGNYIQTLKISVFQYTFSIYTIVSSITIGIIITWLAGIISFVIKSIIEVSSNTSSNNKAMYHRISNYFIYTICIIIILNTMGLSSKNIALIGSALSIGIGLGFQKITSNFVSGVIILAEKNLKIDDLVILPCGRWGYIRQLAIRSSIIETFDSELIIIPNELLINNSITNVSGGHNRHRIKLEFVIPYSYLDQIKVILAEVVDTLRNTPLSSQRTQLKPISRVSNMNDQGITVKSALWVEDVENIWDCKSNAIIEICQYFDKKNIQFALKQIKVNS